MPQRGHGLDRRAPQQGQSLGPEVCAQAQVDQRPEAGVDVAKQRRDRHSRSQRIPSFLKSAPNGANNELDVVRRPAEEEDGHQAGDDHEGPLLLQLCGAAVQPQRDTRAADDQEGCRQQKPQQVVEQARHQLPRTGRWRIILKTHCFMVAGTSRSPHKNPLGGNEDEGADPDAQAGHVSEAGAAS